jgi:hypothetical protein
MIAADWSTLSDSLVSSDVSYRHRMRVEALALLLSGLCLAGCQASSAAPGRLEPASLTYVGFTNELELSFKLGGAPLKDALFSLPAPTTLANSLGDVLFAVEPEGPLGVPPKLLCTLTQLKDSDSTLIVTKGGQAFYVPIHVHADVAPDCGPLNTTCGTSAFDVKTAQCITTPFPDETACGDLVCGDHATLCEKGTCMVVRSPDPLPPCPTGTPQTIPLPVWEHPFGPQQVVDNTTPGVVDAAGNVYVLVDAATAPKTSADVVSLGSLGKERWRRTLPILSGDTNPGCVGTPSVTLAVIADRLLVVSPCVSPNLQSWRLADGTLAWSDTTPVVQVVDAGGGILAATQNSGPTGIIGVLTFDGQTGVRGNLFQLDFSPFFSLVSDGNGFVYGNAANAGMNMVFADAVQRGFQWDNLDAQSFNRNVLATNGKQLYLATGDILASSDGRKLAAVPGVASVLNVATTADRTYLFATSARPDCLQTQTLQRVDAASGQSSWQCRFDAAIAAGTNVVALRNGGVALFGAILVGPSVLTYDAAGNVTTAISLPNIDIASAVVGDQRLWAPKADNSALVAYDIPSLELADHGWVCNGGNPGGSNAPR